MRFRKKIRTLFLGIFAILFVGVCNQVIAQTCVKYGQRVTLTGKLHSRVFPGPPNYESIRKGDLKETALILKLVKKICMSDGNDPLGFDVSLSNIRDMQLVIHKDKHWKTVLRLKGKRAIVTGTLFGAHTGHHRTKILIEVSNIKAPQTLRRLNTRVKKTH